MERIWSIQSEDAWNHLREQGELYGDGRRVYRDFRCAYQWMIRKMQRRITGYSGRYPIWGWIRYSEQHARPDLRCRGHLLQGQRGVRLELLVSEDSMLPHDFNEWHCVLNNWPVTWREEEQDRWDALERQMRFTSLQREREITWDRIFDLVSKERDSAWTGEGHERPIATVFEKITLDQVQKVDHFIAR